MRHWQAILSLSVFIMLIAMPWISRASEGGCGSSSETDTHSHTGVGYENVFQDDFNSFDKNIWSCEYSCPTVYESVAHFELMPDVAPNNEGSWSKIRYKPRRFTSGKFTVTFALSERSVDQAVWWGIALWDDGPNPDGSEFNEINFGYTTDQSYTNTQLRFESAKRGKYVSLKVDTGVDLYDGAYHTASLVYDATRVELYFDDRLLKTITDPSVIPTDSMDYIIGPRLVTGSEPLTFQFNELVDSTVIEW